MWSRRSAGSWRRGTGLATAHGQMALVLAKAMDNPAEMGSSLAALSRELSRVLDEAAEAAPVWSLTDELRRRRDLRQAGLTPSSPM